MISRRFSPRAAYALGRRDFKAGRHRAHLCPPPVEGDYRAGRMDARELDAILAAGRHFRFLNNHAALLLASGVTAEEIGKEILGP